MSVLPVALKTHFSDRLQTGCFNLTYSWLTPFFLSLECQKKHFGETISTVSLSSNSPCSWQLLLNKQASKLSVIALLLVVFQSVAFSTLEGKNDFFFVHSICSSLCFFLTVTVSFFNTKLQLTVFPCSKLQCLMHLLLKGAPC